ncbi:MAG: peroxiredoxin [Clostridium sp.]|nr:peroxiredoxin [Clostridium sp.]
MNIKDLNIKLNGIDELGTEKEYNISDFAGKTAIIYFYPKDNTSGCTQEACDFKENKNRWTSKAVVIGVSPDSIKSHKNFKEKHGLNFILLSDPEHILSEKFEVWGEKSMYGRKYMGIIRSTFLIDKKGEIIKEWRKVKLKGHVDEVISELEVNINE